MIPLRSAPARIAIVLATISVVLSGVQAAPAVGAPAPYVALGDSYTAGPFIPNQLGDPPGCRRSDHNYPHLVARVVGAALRDVSCSGATTKDMTSRQRVSGGSNRPQLDALDPGVGTVSVQIGGNDIGFSEIMGRCVSPLPLGTPCRDFYTRAGADEISRRIGPRGTTERSVAIAGRRGGGEVTVFCGRAG